MPGESKTSPRRIEAYERQRKAVAMRLAGVPFDRIAKELGYKDRGGAYHAVMVALKKTLQEPSDELRTLEVTRLDRMLQGLWEKIKTGDEAAIDRGLRISKRRSELLGLDMPAKLDLTTGGQDFVSFLKEVLSAPTGGSGSPAT